MWGGTGPISWTRLLTIVSIVTEPRLILADELSVGLAPVVVDEIFPGTGS
jgi:ABC-type branched-subunit amino acid transport system ATPase component